MKKTSFVVLILALSLACLSLNSFGQVVVNEYSCSNIKQYKYRVDTLIYDSIIWFENSKVLDDLMGAAQDTSYFVSREIDSSFVFFDDIFGNTEDWIELYNKGNDPLNIGGYYISDNPDKPKKFKIPENTNIPANGFLWIWVSGKDTLVEGQIHTNFKLTQSGIDAEFIVLADKQGEIIEKVKIETTLAHHSKGRKSDGDPNWSVFTNPTPNASNFLSKSFKGYNQPPQFSQAAGFYNQPQSIAIMAGTTDSIVYYTLDGTEPNTTSMIYQSPISIDATTILKAIALSKDTTLLPGPIKFATYFINEDHNLPVISIAGTYLDSLATGQKDYLPWGSIEYFDSLQTLATWGYGEFNSHGQDSWIHDQRSIDFVAKDQLGYSKELKAKLFGLTDRTGFQRIILRAAGDDNYPATTQGVQNYSNFGSAHMRDAYFQNLCKSGDLKLDTRTAEKAIVYLNGHYWGVYDIREIPDDHDYTKYYYNQDENDLQYIETWGDTWAEYGGDQALQDWRRLRNFIMQKDMRIQENFDKVAEELNVKSLVDYVISHSLSVSSDWLNYNTGWWRGLNEKGDHKKWGYILWDNDASYAFYINYTGIPDTSATAAVCNVEGLMEWSDPEKHIKILNKLRKNEAFNNYYIMRYNDLMNTVFSCENMLHQLDSIKALIEPEMQRHIQRWPGGSFEEWQQNVERLRYFIERRCGARADTEMDSCYNLTGPYDVTFDAYPVNAGKIKVNSLSVDNLPWNATYYGGIDIQMVANPDSVNEYIFKSWEANFNSFLDPMHEKTNRIQLNGNDSITAVFKIYNPDYDQKPSAVGVELFPNYVKTQASLLVTVNEPSIIDIKLINLTGVSHKLFSSGDSKIIPGNYNYTISPAAFHLDAGMYLVQVTINGVVYTKKMVYNP